SAELRDIGTQFGVLVDWRGSTAVVVKRGIVQARSGTGAYRSPRASESATVLGDGRIATGASIDASQFAFTIESWRYRPRSSSAVRWEPRLKAQVDASQVESDVQAVLFLERAEVALAQRPGVPIREPGSYRIHLLEPLAEAP